MKRWIALALFMIPLLVSAQSFWEGSAALQRGDAAFESSLSAVSNSFPPGTRVLIENLETGKSTEATVSQRSNTQSDILILLSPKAADAVGIQQGSISRVRVTVLEKPPTTAAAGSNELAYNPDPDINPGGTYRERETRTAQAANQAAAEQPAATPETAQTTEQPTTEQQTTQQAGTEQPTTEQAQQQTTPQATQPVPDAAATAAAAAAAAKAAEDQKILADAAARQPQKQLFLPPREDEKFAWHPGPQTPPQPEQPQVAQTPSTSETPSVIGEPGGPGSSQENVPLAEAQPGSGSTPQEVTGGTGQPAVGENGAQLALPESTPEGIQPSQTEASGTQAATPEQGAQPSLTAPEAPGAGTAATPTSPGTGPVQIAAVPANPRAAEKAGQVQTVASLPKLNSKKKAATFYLQLGAYETQEVAMSMAGRLPQVYPVVVLTPPAEGKQTYRVLVGPLNKAESGTLLPLFKFRGFRDAFIRAE